MNATPSASTCRHIVKAERLFFAALAKAQPFVFDPLRGSGYSCRYFCLRAYTRERGGEVCRLVFEQLYLSMSAGVGVRGESRDQGAGKENGDR